MDDGHVLGGATMSDLLEFSSDEDGAILVEVTDAPGQGPATRGRLGSAVIEAGEDFEKVLGKLRPLVRGMVSAFADAAHGPDEVEVAFAVKISADSNVIIARAGGEANFSITLRWSGAGPG